MYLRATLQDPLEALYGQIYLEFVAGAEALYGAADV
jgi:hypothetical protein